MLREDLSASDSAEEQLPVLNVLRHALKQTDFWLLALGFLVCGFQVVFIGIHIPAYLAMIYRWQVRMLQVMLHSECLLR